MRTQAYDVFAKFIYLTIANLLGALSHRSQINLDTAGYKFNMVNIKKGFFAAMAPVSQLILRFSCKDLECKIFVLSSIVPGMTKHDNFYWDVTVDWLLIDRANGLLYDPVNPDFSKRYLKMFQQFPELFLFNCKTCGRGLGLPFIITPKLTWLLRIEFALEGSGIQVRLGRKQRQKAAQNPFLERE